MKIPAMFKSAASAVVLVGVIVVVTSVGAVALRLYSLACRARAALGRNWPGYAAKPASR
jgi:hypothetical protein